MGLAALHDQLFSTHQAITTADVEYRVEVAAQLPNTISASPEIKVATSKLGSHDKAQHVTLNNNILH
jgi:hypothetical protein